MPKITSTQPQGRTGDFRQGAGRWGRPDYKQAIAGSRGRILAASSTCHPGQAIQAWWRGCLHQLKIPLFRYSHPEHPVLLVGKPPSVDVGWVSAGGASGPQPSVLPKSPRCPLQTQCHTFLPTSFHQMMSEKQKAEEQAREAAAETSEVELGPATTTEQLSEQPVVEQTWDLESLDVQTETWMNDRSPAGTSSPKKEAPSLEKGTPMQKTEPAENHEKVPSSREKRESRRQRGLEHVELQNKHIQSCKEESSTLREPSRRASLETGEHFPEDTKGYREDGLPSGAWTEATAHSPSKQVQVVEAPPGSPSLSPIQRPTSLALDNRVIPVVPITTPESPKDKAKGGDSLKAQDKPESPSGSTQIQRYQHPDTERLATAVELWRGKKLIAAGGTSTMLSQSLDLSEKHRAIGAALTPTE